MSIIPDEFYKCECGWLGPDIHMKEKFDYDDLYCPKCGASNYSDSMNKLDDREIKIALAKALALGQFDPLTNINVREIFKCRQCGSCCLNIDGAAEADCRDEDWNRWVKEKRHDILSRIETIKIQGHVFARDMWFKLTKDGRRGEMVSRCPWIRKQGEKYICRIHNTKPGHCRNFIPSPELAKKIGCQGWNDD